MYFVSMLRMILRQSLGLLVISPKTLLFRLLPVSEYVISIIYALVRCNLSWRSSSLLPYWSICPSLTFRSIGLAMRSMSLASKSCSRILRTSCKMFYYSVSSLPFFFLRRFDCFFLSFSILTLKLLWTRCTGEKQMGIAPICRISP